MAKEGFIELNINGWQDLKELVTWQIKDARLQRDALNTPIVALTLSHPLSEKDYTLFVWPSVKTTISGKNIHVDEEINFKVGLMQSLGNAEPKEG